MGGTICVAIRRTDGCEIVYSRWTNPLPYYMVDPLFRQEDENTLQLFHDSVVNSMKNGWGSEIIDKIFPIEYGIIAIDFKTKNILSLQGYCQPCVAHFYYLNGRGSSSAPEDDMKLIHRLLKDGEQPLDFDSFGKRVFDNDYVEKLTMALDNALTKGDTVLPGWVRSMTFSAPKPFTIHHQDIYDYNWDKDGYEWFKSRGWKTPVTKLPDEFKF